MVKEQLGPGVGRWLTRGVVRLPSWGKVKLVMSWRGFRRAECNVMFLQSLQLRPSVSLWMFISLLMQQKCHWFGCLVSGLVIWCRSLVHEHTLCALERLRSPRSDCSENKAENVPAAK